MSGRELEQVVEEENRCWNGGGGEEDGSGESETRVWVGRRYLPYLFNFHL